VRGGSSNAPSAPSQDEGQPDRGDARSALREQLYVVIFGTDTPAGKLFDIALLVVIVISVAAVLLESVAEFESRFGGFLRGLEIAVTVLFSIEYGLRLYVARRRLRYALSFFGLVDLLSLLPTFVSIVFTTAPTLSVIRALRLLRVFRVLKVMRHVGEAHNLMQAIRASIPKISVFLGVVTIVAMIVGALMYVIEDPKDGFTSVPRSMYWAIVTMTTVGYGDIAPKTVLGQTVAAMLMIVGYGIIAVPTGIVSAQMVGGAKERSNDASPCQACGIAGHETGANFCRICGSGLD